jgi:hypothetical protein
MVIALALVFPLSGQAQVTANVLFRVRLIKAGGNVGTSFTLDVDGRQYLVTAKHVVKDLKAEDTILMFKEEGQWSPPMPVKVFRCDEPIDIAILVPPTQLTPSFPFEPGNFYIGQESYFAGFPFGLSLNRMNINGIYPIPFLKRSIISAQDTQKNAHIVFLDGINNPGFSGGPVVFRDLDQRQATFRIAAVISAYRPEFIPTLVPEPVKQGEDVSSEEAWRILTKDGVVVSRLKDTTQLTRMNSGIVIAYHIRHAIDLIRLHPIGPKITQ